MPFRKPLSAGYNIEHLPLFHIYKIKPLENSEINAFIELQLKNETEVASKIIKSLQDNKSEYIDEFLTNPLLLSLYILTFQSNSEIPDKKYIFYRRVVNALFSEHDSKTKLGYVREKLSNLTQEQFEEILKAYSLLSYFENKFNFDRDYVESKLQIIKKKIPHIPFENGNFIIDLKSAIALWVEDYGIYSFAHRSIQEYFAALFVKNLNIQDKEKMYNKIVSKQVSAIAIREMDNFLSICEEMDTLYFYKYYSLPILYEIRDYFHECANEKEVICKFLLFYTNRMPKDMTGILSNNRFSEYFKKSVYFTLPSVQKLLEIIMDLHHQKKLPIKCKYESETSEIQIYSKNHEAKQFHEVKEDYLDLSKNIPEKLIKILMKTEILNIAQEMMLDVDKKIELQSEFISLSFGLENDLVELI